MFLNPVSALPGPAVLTPDGPPDELGRLRAELVLFRQTVALHEEALHAAELKIQALATAWTKGRRSLCSTTRPAAKASIPAPSCADGGATSWWTITPVTKPCSGTRPASWSSVAWPTRGASSSTWQGQRQPGCRPRPAAHCPVLPHRGQGRGPTDVRQRFRAKHAKSRLYHAWLVKTRAAVPDGTDTAKAIDYTLKRWPALVRCAETGHLPIDNNPVENAIRPIAIGKKN